MGLDWGSQDPLPLGYAPGLSHLSTTAATGLLLSALQIDCCTVRRAVLARLPTRQLARRACGAQQQRRRSRRRRTKQVRAASLCQPAIEAADGFVYIYNVRT